MSIPYTISAVLSPFLGLAVDRFGRRAVVIVLAPVVLIGVHLSLGREGGREIGRKEGRRRGESPCRGGGRDAGSRSIERSALTSR